MGYSWQERADGFERLVKDSLEDDLMKPEAWKKQDRECISAMVKVGEALGIKQIGNCPFKCVPPYTYPTRDELAQHLRMCHGVSHDRLQEEKDCDMCQRLDKVFPTGRVDVGNPLQLTPEEERLIERKKTEGRKDDDGKLRYDLIPVYPLERLAEVYTIGAGIYDDNNWRKGMRWGRIFRALMSHAWKWWGGERNDPKDGQHHLASVVWTAFTLMEYEKYNLGTDDRWKHSSS